MQLEGTEEDNQDVDIAGAGNYQSTTLVSRTASVEIDGAGTAVLNVADQLSVTINGPGTVKYVGQPRVQPITNGIGTVLGR